MSSLEASAVDVTISQVNDDAMLYAIISRSKRKRRYPINTALPPPFFVSPSPNTASAFPED